jgi:glycosyltransferase involved in cell wall biosynthesis
MKTISIMTPCYNEEDNVRELYEAVKSQFAKLPQYRYEHLFIDNASKDRTAALLREIAAADPNVKVIINTRNFGHVRSPYHGVLQCTGDCVISMAADFQDPVDMIPKFLEPWEQGYKMVLAVKETANESAAMFAVRTAYYRLVARLSDVKLVKNHTGFGLYDQKVIAALRQIDDPYPYFRGLIADIGYEPKIIYYNQPTRKRGITKNNFYTLYDVAMLGFTNHSRIPIRMAAMGGFAMSLVSLLVALGYLVAKLVWWNTFQFGLAPIIVALFFFSSVQLFFIGIIGEYIGAVLTQVQKRPLVIERERINF